MSIVSTSTFAICKEIKSAHLGKLLDICEWTEIFLSVISFCFRGFKLYRTLHSWEWFGLWFVFELSRSSEKQPALTACQTFSAKTGEYHPWATLKFRVPIGCILRELGQFCNSFVTLVICSVYSVCPSLLSCSNLKLHQKLEVKTLKMKIIL